LFVYLGILALRCALRCVLGAASDEQQETWATVSLPYPIVALRLVLLKSSVRQFLYLSLANLKILKLKNGKDGVVEAIDLRAATE
jgi:hypothetical protein